MNNCKFHRLCLHYNVWIFNQFQIIQISELAYTTISWYIVCLQSYNLVKVLSNKVLMQTYNCRILKV